MPDVTLLGPQRRRSTVGAPVRGVDGTVALITAGWQESEGERLPRGLRERGIDLGLHRRAERVFDEDRELFEAHRERQGRLKQLQALYRLRLDHAMAAFKELRDLPEDGEELVAERRAALEAVRRLDGGHLERVRAINEAFDARWRPTERPAVAEQRHDLIVAIDTAAAVVVAGGHVAALLNRLRLFDLAPLLAGKKLIAWSGGAMVAGTRIVLFHDSPPWGAGNAEVLDAGLGLFEGVLPFPDAGRRLELEDPRRVALLAERFAPLRCVGLEGGSEVCLDAGSWRARRALRLGVDGEAAPLGARRWEALPG